MAVLLLQVLLQTSYLQIGVALLTAVILPNNGKHGFCCSCAALAAAGPHQTCSLLKFTQANGAQQTLQRCLQHRLLTAGCLSAGLRTYELIIRLPQPAHHAYLCKHFSQIA